MSGFTSRSVRTRLIQKFEISVGPSSSFDTPLNLFEDYRATQYFVEFSIPVDSRFLCASLNVVKRNSDLQDQLFGKVGDSIDFSISVLKVGTDAVMRITNNEVSTLEVVVIRITQ